MKARYLVSSAGREVEGIGRIVKASYHGGSHTVKVWLADSLKEITLPADQDVTLVPLPGAWVTQSQWLTQQQKPDRAPLVEYFADVEVKE